MLRRFFGAMVSGGGGAGEVGVVVKQGRRNRRRASVFGMARFFSSFLFGSRIAERGFQEGEK